MGRIINPEGAGKQRTLLLKGLTLALRELSYQNEITDSTRDLAAYVVLSLRSISDTVNSTVEPWEKRGYWLKADRFHFEWAWTEQLGQKMYQALIKEDWENVAFTVAQISQKLRNTSTPKRSRLGTPWVGAWKELMKSEKPAV